MASTNQRRGFIFSIMQPRQSLNWTFIARDRRHFLSEMPVETEFSIEAKAARLTLLWQRLTGALQRTEVRD